MASFTKVLIVLVVMIACSCASSQLISDNKLQARLSVFPVSVVGLCPSVSDTVFCLFRPHRFDFTSCQADLQPSKMFLPAEMVSSKEAAAADLSLMTDSRQVVAKAIEPRPQASTTDLVPSPDPLLLHIVH